MKWNELIGQEVVKSRLDFHFEAFMAGDALPSLMFCAPRGFGKTTIAEAFAGRVKEATKGEKRSFTINAAAVKNLKQFWNSVIIPIINDRDVTLTIDEASELPHDVTMALLTMLQPNPERRNQFSYDDMTVDIDMRRQTFIMATTETHKIFKPLMDRCRRIDLETYSYGDLAKILKRHAKEIKFGPHVLEAIAPVLRGNPRQAVHMANDIETYLAPKRRHEFEMDDWDKIRKRLGILPLGINALELKALRAMQLRPEGSSLTRIAASLMMSPAAVQKDLELYLQNLGLMEITTNGRTLTAQGYEYLKAVDKEVAENTKKK